MAPPRMNAHRRKGPLVLGLSAAIVAGCGAYVVTPGKTPDIPTPQGAAKVCIVRRGAEGALATFPMRDNGVLVGATVGGSCFCYFAGAGKHALEARSDGFDSLDLDAKAGTDYYVLQSTQAAVGIVRSRLETMDPDEGKSAMTKCNYAILTQVPDGTYKAKPEMVIVPQ